MGASSDSERVHFFHSIMKIFAILAASVFASRIPQVSENDANSFLSRERRSPQAVCRDDCTDACLDECQEEHLERIYQYDSTRQIQVREYFFQRSAFDKK